MEEVLAELLKSSPTFLVLLTWIISERARNERLETELRQATKEHIRTLETIKEISHHDQPTKPTA